MQATTRYYDIIESGADPKGQGELRLLKNYIDGQWVRSKSATLRDAFNPSTGQIIAKVPASLPEELDEAVASAKKAWQSWADTPVYKRVKVLFNMQALVKAHQDELIRLLCMEQGGERGRHPQGARSHGICLRHAPAYEG